MNSRERFEAWADSYFAANEGKPWLNGLNSYWWGLAWEAWQAALAAAAPPPDPEKDLGESKKNQQNSGPDAAGALKRLLGVVPAAAHHAGGNPSGDDFVVPYTRVEWDDLVAATKHACDTLAWLGHDEYINDHDPNEGLPPWA